MNQVYIATDGGCSQNGKATAIARWAYVVYTGGSIDSVVTATGQLSNQESTNNRSELTAILEALKYIENYGIQNTIIISDSLYSINCIEVWYPNWLTKPKMMSTKKNIDLISLLYTKTKQIRQAGHALKYVHCRGHQKQPGSGEPDYLFWKLNDIADKLTQTPPI